METELSAKDILGQVVGVSHGPTNDYLFITVENDGVLLVDKKSQVWQKVGTGTACHVEHGLHTFVGGRHQCAKNREIDAIQTFILLCICIAEMP